MSNIKRIRNTEIVRYLSMYAEEKKLKVCHMAILTAILYLGCRQRQIRKIRVSRSKIMAVSHIGSVPTYHKYFKELQEMGYFKYIPSYHPGVRSEVILNKKGVSQKMG